MGDNLVARTGLGRRWRLVLGRSHRHRPGRRQRRAVDDGDRLCGLGAADMKGGLAVMLDLARASPNRPSTCTYVFYAREEVASAESGLGELFADAPICSRAMSRCWASPPERALEAGCQGTMRLAVTLAGERAHTARPWMGRNAVHRLAGLLGALDGYQERRPVVDGCEYREALQAVSVEGGVAGNVVPDEVRLVLNHRFAPDRTPAEAEATCATWSTRGSSPATPSRWSSAPTALRRRSTHPLLAALVARHGLEVRAKLGWTDVARFAEHGVPAANFGPGEADGGPHAGGVPRPIGARVGVAGDPRPADQGP